MNDYVTLNELMVNLSPHQKNEHKGEAQVFITIPNVGTFPLSGGVSTYGNNVVIFAANKKLQE